VTSLSGRMLLPLIADPEAPVPNVVYVPRRAPTGSAPPNPPTTRGWEAAPPPVQTGGKEHQRGRRRANRRWQKGKAMNKTEFIERIAQEAGVPEGEAQRHFGAFERVVAEALKGGEEVRITGFGKFSVKERKAREGRNPQTGEKMKIKASKAPSFSAGNALKQAI
jgi:DNA-binding protein HU-beta